MKRLLAVLLAVVLCVPVMAAEATDLWLTEHMFDQLDETTVRVQMLVTKDGATPYMLSDVEVVLYDAQRDMVPLASQEIVLQPLRSAPAGKHYILVTVDCVLESPAQIAKVDVLSVSGSELAAADTVALDWDLPFMAMMGHECMELTAWMPLEEGTDAKDYFATLIVLDEDGSYLGNEELPAGRGYVVAGEDIIDEIARRTGYGKDWLDANGYAFHEEAYVFFANVPLDMLTRLPRGIMARCYRKCEEEQGMPVALAFDRIDVSEDGSFVIHGVMENVSGGLWRLDSLESLTLYDASGRTVDCDRFTYDMPFNVLEAGELLPYRIEGRVEPGFAAERFHMAYTLSPADKTDHRSVPGGNTLPAFDGSGNVAGLSVTMPLPEGAQAQDCFVCVLFLDLVNDDYYGAAWTMPGDARLKDGTLELPMLALPQPDAGAAAMMTSYYVAE